MVLFLKLILLNLILMFSLWKPQIRLPPPFRLFLNAPLSTLCIWWSVLGQWKAKFSGTLCKTSVKHKNRWTVVNTDRNPTHSFLTGTEKWSTHWPVVYEKGVFYGWLLQMFTSSEWKIKHPPIQDKPHKTHNALFVLRLWDCILKILRTWFNAMKTLAGTCKIDVNCWII